MIPVSTLLCTRRRRAHDLDNRWVVPFNPYCATKYNCHMSVEICASINSVKYVCKCAPHTAILCSCSSGIASTSASVTATCLHCPTLHTTYCRYVYKGGDRA